MYLAFKHVCSYCTFNKWQALQSNNINSKHKLEKQKIIKSKYVLQEGITDVCVSTDNFYTECAE